MQKPTRQPEASVIRFASGRATCAAILLATLLVLAATPALAGDPPQQMTQQMAEEDVAVIETNHGTMAFRFLAEGAPRTVAHIKQLIGDGFFDGKTFYRVVAGHVIQGGAGYDTEGGETVPGEFGAYPHVTGAVGLARDADPDSGSTEIYICHAPRPHLDGSYAVFGLLVEGHDVLDAIGNLPVVEQWDGEVAIHRPKEPVVIERIRLERRALPPIDTAPIDTAPI